MLSCINISKHFLLGNSLKSVKVLKDVSLNIDAGQITALKGPSGSGKSTLLNLISGLEEPSYGEIYLNKTCLNKLSINELSSFRNNNIGIIFQFFNLINDLSILENISLPLLLRGVTKKTAEQNARVLIDNIGLLDRIDSRNQIDPCFPPFDSCWNVNVV